MRLNLENIIDFLKSAQEYLFPYKKITNKFGKISSEEDLQKFIQERSANGDFFFAEATAPDGTVSFGSSNDSQWGADNMATRHCSEKSGKICRITQTKALPRKGNLLGIF